MPTANHVLVTGGGGFIGRHLVESQLAQGRRVRVVDLHLDGLADTHDEGRLEVLKADIRDRAAAARMMEGIDEVYHLASAHLDVSLSERVFWEVNVDATVTLLEAASAAAVRCFVHCSTIGVFGRLPVPPPADENSPCTPTHVYERSKLEGERRALDHCRRTGLPVVVSRPAWVYGPGCPRTRKLLRTAATGRFVLFGNGRTLRHPLYVADAVRGLERCAQVPGACGQVYVMAGPEPVAIEQLVHLAGEAQGVRVKTIHLPVVLGHTAGWALEWAFKPLRRSPPFSRRSMDFFLKDNLYDTSKAARDLGFEATVRLVDGLRLTVAQRKQADRHSTDKKGEASACVSA
jgi:nucleoside-diphosphate-sugar epimerase